MQKKDIIECLLSADAGALLDSARFIRDMVFGREILQRGVIEFSNRCRKNCRYCGLRRGNSALGRFALTPEQILAAARTAIDAGLGTVVLQSGEEPDADIRGIGRIITAIKDMGDVAVTLSLGDHDEDTYRYWRDCGADRYLLKMETFDPVLHERLRPGQSARERLGRIETLQRLGFETGSGIITGLPGMTPDILAEDVLRLRDLSLDMIAAGPFVPHPGTPLGHCGPGSVREALRVVALLRIMNPLANIPATSALDALAPNGREQGLHAGANVVMPSVTPDAVRAGYSIYPGKNTDTVPATLRRLHQRLLGASYHPSSARGNRTQQGATQ